MTPGKEGGAPRAPGGADKNGREPSDVAAALVRAGVSPPVARRMLDARGALWCRQLLAYGRWQRAHARVGGGWYCRTWQQWVAWPDAFERWWERERAAERRTVRAPGPAVPAAPAGPSEGESAGPAGPAALVEAGDAAAGTAGVAPPTPPTAPPPAPRPPRAAEPRPERADGRRGDGGADGPPAGEGPLPARLTDAERRALRERAEQELRCALPGAPPALVRALAPKRMRSICESERCGGAAHDTIGAADEAAP